MRRSFSVALVLLAAAGLAVGCGSTSSKTSSPDARTTCPKAWEAGWQKLADQIGTAVYCPSWMPQPLDAKIGGDYANGRSVDPKGGSYLVSFVWVDHDVGGVTGEVHVNLRGYPQTTAIPSCPDTLTVEGVTKHPNVPCFADPRWHKRFGDTTITAYTANQGADQWHVLYAWRRDGSLYTVSEHVAPPFGYRGVVRNLNRMMRGLVLVKPGSTVMVYNSGASG
jgi:hypothetical protein